MNKQKELDRQVAILRGKIINAGSPQSPWYVYDAKVVEKFIDKLFEIVSSKKA